ncbi:hypothetical protein Tco_0866079, partial [Tanacetum coccineum]
MNRDSGLKKGCDKEQRSSYADNYMRLKTRRIYWNALLVDMFVILTTDFFRERNDIVIPIKRFNNMIRFINFPKLGFYFILLFLLGVCEILSFLLFPGGFDPQLLVEHFTPVEDNTGVIESDVFEGSTCLMLLEDVT